MIQGVESAHVGRHGDEMQAAREEILWLRDHINGLRDLQVKDLQVKDEQHKHMVELLQAKDQQIRDLMSVVLSPGAAVPSSHRPAAPATLDPLLTSSRVEPRTRSSTSTTKIHYTHEEGLIAQNKGQPLLPMKVYPHRGDGTVVQGHMKHEIQSSSAPTAATSASARAHVNREVEGYPPSNLDKAKVLLASLQNGKPDELVAVLEHALAVLEKMSAASNRKARKVIDELCERVENTVDELDKEEAMDQLASCEVSELKTLAEHLKAVSDMDHQAEGADKECLSVVTAAMEALTRCRDPVAGASRLLASQDAAARMRGLETLRALPRMTLAQAVESEVAVASVVCEMAFDESRGEAELVSVWLSFCALWWRNGDAISSSKVAAKMFIDGVSGVCDAAFAGRMNAKTMAAAGTVGCLANEFATKSETATMRGSIEKMLLVFLAKCARLNCTAARCEELLPALLRLNEHEDLVFLVFSQLEK